MTIYLNNIPLPNDDLSTSQGDLLGNFQALNTIYGIDHYPYTDTSAQQGFHNVVTTPVITPQAHPATGVHQTKLYNNFETQTLSTKAVGPIQFSRGENNAVPSPVTSIQSTAAAVSLAPLANDLVIDFTGLNRAIGTLYGFDDTTSTVNGTSFVTAVFWDGSAIALRTMTATPSDLQAQATGALLQVHNRSASVTFNNVYWTFTLQRLS